MKLRITFEVDEQTRKAIAHHFRMTGKRGSLRLSAVAPASHANVASVIESVVEAHWDDLRLDYRVAVAQQEDDATEAHYAKVGE